VLPRPDDLLANERRAVDGLSERINLALLANARAHRTAFERIGARLGVDKLTRIIGRTDQRAGELASRGARAQRALLGARKTTLGAYSARLSVAGIIAQIGRGGQRVHDLDNRISHTWGQANARRRSQLDSQGNLLEALSYRGVLARGFALVTDDQRRAIRSAAQAERGRVMSIRFHDGDVEAVSRGRQAAAPGRKRSSGDDSQGSLL